ncbi:DnaJ domain-containing protein [Cytophagaceae bacterium ABcell3]|nr:DnaJ domain-containing protein [Cytophagaceae bacterium ABcell3]
MNSKWYRELELTPGADKEQIKKAFRRLAKRYHPDINQAPGAQAKFIRLRQAHDHLMNPEKYRRPTKANYTKTSSTKNTRRSRYSTSQKNSSTNRNNAKEEQRKKADERRKKAEAKRWARNEEAMRKICYFMKYPVAFLLLFNALLVIDYTLPAVKSTETTVLIYQYGKKSARHTSNPNARDKVYFTNGKALTVKPYNLGLNEEVTLYSTRLFGFINYAEIFNGERILKFEALIHPTKTFWPLIAIYFICSLMFLLIVKSTEIKMKIGIAGLFDGIIHLTVIYFLS